MLLALLGFVASVYFYLRGKRERRPVYLTRSFLLLNDNVSAIPGLTVQYHGAPVTSLSMTKVAFWNAGAELIDSADLVRSDPLRLVATGTGEILGIKTSYVRRSANCLEVKYVAGAHELHFDYLGNLDGIVLDVYHPKTCEISIAGTVKGAKDVQVANPAATWEKKVNKIVKKLPVPSVPFIGNVVLFLYLPLLLPLILPVILTDLFWNATARAPKEYTFGGAE